MQFSLHFSTEWSVLFLFYEMDELSSFILHYVPQDLWKQRQCCWQMLLLLFCNSTVDTTTEIVCCWTYHWIVWSLWKRICSDTTDSVSLWCTNLSCCILQHNMYVLFNLKLISETLRSDHEKEMKSWVGWNWLRFCWNKYLCFHIYVFILIVYCLCLILGICWEATFRRLTLYGKIGLNFTWILFLASCCVVNFNISFLPSYAKFALICLLLVIKFCFIPVCFLYYLEYRECYSVPAWWHGASIESVVNTFSHFTEYLSHFYISGYIFCQEKCVLSYVSFHKPPSTVVSHSWWLNIWHFKYHATVSWGYSSVGREFAWHVRGNRDQ